jgi:hypothetical protein
MRKQTNTHKQRGQSMIETALMFPIFLILFAGMIEVVYICRSYLAILGGSYQGAHLGSQGYMLYDDNEVYTLVTQDLSPRYNNSNLVDVIITRATWNGTNLSFDLDPVTNKRYPKNMKGSTAVSILTKVILEKRLKDYPATRLIVVEVVYNQPLLFNFPIIWDLIPDPFPLVAYTIQYVAR